MGASVTAGCAWEIGGCGITGCGFANGGICGTGLEACLFGAFRENWFCTQPDNRTTSKATTHGAQTLL
jgi:hypothetical protein